MAFPTQASHTLYAAPARRPPQPMSLHAPTRRAPAGQRRAHEGANEERIESEKRRIPRMKSAQEEDGGDAEEKEGSRAEEKERSRAEANDRSRAEEKGRSRAGEADGGDALRRKRGAALRRQAGAALLPFAFALYAALSHCRTHRPFPSPSTPPFRTPVLTALSRRLDPPFPVALIPVALIPTPLFARS